MWIVCSVLLAFFQLALSSPSILPKSVNQLSPVEESIYSSAKVPRRLERAARALQVALKWRSSTNNFETAFSDCAPMLFTDAADWGINALATFVRLPLDMDLEYVPQRLMAIFGALTPVKVVRVQEMMEEFYYFVERSDEYGLFNGVSLSEADLGVSVYLWIEHDLLLQPFAASPVAQRIFSEITRSKEPVQPEIIKVVTRFQELYNASSILPLIIESSN